jgi:hypothetical protein
MVTEACVIACFKLLKAVQQKGLICIDSLGYAFKEYRKYCSFKGQPGLGDAFFKFLNDHQWRPERCERVEITPLNPEGTEFAEFPGDARLRGFDPSDRKWVAIVLASGNRPRVQNATDSDWIHFRKALLDNGVSVDFLCPEILARE